MTFNRGFITCNNFNKQCKHHELGAVNSILDWNENLAAIFEAKLTYIDVQCQSPSIVLTCATTRSVP